MKILSAAGLVSQVRDGRQIICIAADYSEMEALAAYLLSECCADSDEPTKGHDHG